MIDRATHMGHLKGCLIEFCRAFFGVDDLPVRFRPSYFPFTEPSAEVDIGCSREGGGSKSAPAATGSKSSAAAWSTPRCCRIAASTRPQYQGFAFGMGIERVAMLKYGIPDLRTFYESDLRWLRHYGFLPLDIPSLVRGPLTGAGADEDDARLAQDPSRHRRVAGRDRRAAGHARPRCRSGRKPRRGARTLHRRLGRFGRAAPECRPAQALHRRHRRRARCRWCAARPTRAPA